MASIKSKAEKIYKFRQKGRRYFMACLTVSRQVWRVYFHKEDDMRLFFNLIFVLKSVSVVRYKDVKNASVPKQKERNERKT